MNQKTAKPDLQKVYGEAAAAFQRQDVQTALAKAQELLRFYPQQEALLNLAAVCLAQSGREEEAVALWQKIPDAKKSHSVLNNLGNACRRLKQFDLAEKYVRKALKLKPDHAEAHWHLVLVLADAGKHSDGLKAAKAFLALKPDDAAGLEYAAVFAFNAQDFAEADRFQTALLAQQPERTDIWRSNAWAKRRLQRYAEAAAAYETVLARGEDDAEAWFGLAKMRHFLQQYEAACEALERALALDAENLEAQADYVLNLLYLPNRAADAAAAACRLGDLYAARAVCVPPPAAPQMKERLRVGLVSSDLRRHPVGMFAKSLLLSHAAAQFDWVAYANSAVFDDISRQIRPVFAQWHDISAWEDVRVIEQIRADGIDILIDLNGHTAGHRMGVFAAQAAPVQASWLGYFAGTGLAQMQALLADPVCVPSEEEHFYREKIYRLPHTRLCMAAPEDAPAPNPLPALSKGHITFGCFQNLTKLNNHVLKAWAWLAQRLPDAHWRFQTARLAEGAEREAFRQKLLALGFPSGQIHFHGHSGTADYFAAHHEVDMILDTFPFPGGTTTVDALWMGVPTLTLAMEGMLSRQGQQLLSAAGLGAWVCTSLEEYWLKALHWADGRRRAELAELRRNLRFQAAQSPVFDGERFGQDWCATVRQVWADACAGVSES